MSNPLDRLAGGVFVGRERELEPAAGRLRRRALRSGAGRAAGRRAGHRQDAPGRGDWRPTRRLRGAQVLWGRCYEWEGAPAYWPWVQMIRGYVHDRDPQALRSELGSGAPDIAQIVSEVRERLPGSPASCRRCEAEQAPLPAVRGASPPSCATPSDHQPLVLVLDDLHWADTPSLCCSQFVARELRQRRLLLRRHLPRRRGRPPPPAASTLAELTRGHGTQRITLRGLTTAEIARFITLTRESRRNHPGRRRPPRDRGQPVLRQRGRAAAGRRGTPRREAGHGLWSVSMPESVREVVGGGSTALVSLQRRPDGRLGRRPGVHPPDPGAGQCAPEAILEALEEAVRARLIQEEVAAGRYRFTHALVQDTLYAELSAGRRLRLHAKVGKPWSSSSRPI